MISESIIKRMLGLEEGEQAEYELAMVRVADEMTKRVTALGIQSTQSTAACLLSCIIRQELVDTINELQVEIGKLRDEVNKLTTKI